MKFKYIIILFVLLITFNKVNCEEIPLPVQNIKLLPAVLYKNAGSSFKILIQYNVSDEDNTLIGLGARFHFDSSKLSFTGAENLFNLFKSPAVQEDKEDFDDRPETDYFVLVAWFEWNGRWPGLSMPCKLGDLEFKIKPDAKGIAEINVSFSANDLGYALDSTPAKILILSD